MTDHSTPQRTRRVLILGANGRFGLAAAQAFDAAGWDVLAQVRRAAAAGMPARARTSPLPITTSTASRPTPPAPRWSSTRSTRPTTPAGPPSCCRWRARAWTSRNASAPASRCPAASTTTARRCPPRCRPARRNGPARARAACAWSWRTSCACARRACAASSCAPATTSAPAAASGSTSSSRRSLAKGSLVYPGPRRSRTPGPTCPTWRARWWACANSTTLPDYVDIPFAG